MNQSASKGHKADRCAPSPVSQNGWNCIGVQMWGADVGVQVWDACGGARVCVHVCMQAYVHVCACLCVYVRVYVCLCAYVRVCVWRGSALNVADHKKVCRQQPRESCVEYQVGGKETDILIVFPRAAGYCSVHTMGMDNALAVSTCRVAVSPRVTLRSPYARKAKKQVTTDSGKSMRTCLVIHAYVFGP